MRRVILALALLLVPALLLAQVNRYPPIIDTVNYASLGTPKDGTIKYCSDCDQTDPCAASGTGSFAFRVTGAWACATTGAGGGLASTGATGFAVETAPGVTTARELTNTDGLLTIQNGDGVSANPVVNVDTSGVMTFSSGTADPPGTCTSPEFYNETDVFELSWCSSEDNFEFIPTFNAQTDDATIVGSGTGFALKVITDCNAANNRVQYDTATNAWSCETADLTFAGLTAATGASKLLGRGSAGGGGDFEEVTLGSGLSMSGTELSSTAGGGLDVTKAVFEDEFSSALATDGSIGDLGWQFAEVGTTGTVSVYATSVANHPGIQRLTTGANDNEGPIIFLAANLNTSDYGSEEWELNVVLRPEDAVTGTFLTVGFYAGTIGSAVSSAIRATYDTDLSHATWIFQVCDSATTGCESAGDDTNSDTVASTKVPIANTFQRVRIRRCATCGPAGVAMIGMSVGDAGAMETEKTFCAASCDSTMANLPTADLIYPAVAIINRTGASRDLDVDFVRLEISGLSRY